MTIQYHGDACVRLSGKHGAQEFAVLVDPYDAKATGLKPLRPSSVDLVLSTTGEVPSFGEGPYVITGPGEYEVRGVSVLGIPFHGKTIFRITAEDVTIAHLGNVAAKLDEATLDRLGDIDVLLVPVGGKEGSEKTPAALLSGANAAELVERMEPRVVIPMQYAVAGSKLPYASAAAFCKETGCSETGAEEKLKANKKELPSDEVWVRVLAVS